MDTSHNLIEKNIFPEIEAPLNEYSSFTSLDKILQKWFYKPDLQALRIVLGTIKAHYLNLGDPAWLFVVAPPGTGKTTMSIMGACGLPEVLTISDFTENTFLSGFHGHREPGILEKVGHTTNVGDTYTTNGNAIFLVKDFTTVLSMRREKRGVILSQLREIHDGWFKRAFGTGITKIWRGRVAIIAAVTPVLDRHYSIFSVLGERFLQLRAHRPDSEEAGEWAIQQQSHEEQIQQEVRETIDQIFKSSSNESPVLPDNMRKRIASLAEVVAIGRTHVYRDNYGKREIEYVPEPEANTRISKGLASIARGIAALNKREEVAEQDFQDTLRVGLDCLTDNRRRLLIAAYQDTDLDSVMMPRTVRSREIEDLEALKIIEPNFPNPRMVLTDRIEKLMQMASLKLS